MKKILSSVLACLLVLSMTACSYQGAIGVTRPSGIISTDPVDPNDPNAFIVTLTLDGEPYVPDFELYAQWTDGYSYYTAKFDENGMAGVSGLDGDYRVTLSAVPEGCSYDVNANMASNDNRRIVIDIRTLLGTNRPGEGNGLYSPHIITLTDLGIYRVTLWDEETTVYFQFYPQENGKYSVESLCDVTQDLVNPVAAIYNGTVAYKAYAYDLDSGSYQSTTGFTKNFKYNVQVSDEMIGNVFAFGVKATTKDGQWPVTVDIAVKFNDGYNPDPRLVNMVAPTEDFRQAPTLGGTFVGAEFPVEGAPGRYLFDQDRYKLWPKDEGGDGYYHLYDEVAYAEFGGYGPTLFAKIDQPCRFLELSFTHLEDPGNASLTLDNGTSNYKHFIQGYNSLITPTTNFPVIDWYCYYCSGNCNCGGGVTESKGHACPPGCPTCDKDCRPCPVELMGKPGYADYCNSDGCYPVTEELQIFLQKLSTSQLYFRDGNGWVEENPIIKVDSDEESQWLFACGYYTGDPGGKCPMGNP